MSTTPGTEPSGDDRDQPGPPSPVDNSEEPDVDAAGVEIGASEREGGSTFEPEEDPEAQR
jgi:hypothetical protein